jgi:hypothetical protein
MMAPIHFRNARMSAPHHILAKITQRSGNRLQVKVKRVFRGDLKCGSILVLPVSIWWNDKRPRPLDSSLYVAESAVARARYVEVFLAGEPPKVVMDQIKFFRVKWFWRPTGDPSLESFLW